MTMPGSVVPVTEEHEGLLADLAQQRDFLRLSFHGLTHEQATATPTVSGLSLAGVIKHAAHTEQRWIAGAVAQRELPDRDHDVNHYAEFGLEVGETLADVIGFYTAVAEETESIVRVIANLDGDVPVPRRVRRVPMDVMRWPIRSVLLHVIEETENHVRAADIVREVLDRTTVRHPLRVVARGA